MTGVKKNENGSTFSKKISENVNFRPNFDTFFASDLTIYDREIMLARTYTFKKNIARFIKLVLFYVTRYPLFGEYNFLGKKNPGQIFPQIFQSKYFYCRTI